MIILLGVAHINSGIVKSDYDSSTTMFNTTFEKDIQNIALSNLNTNDFDLIVDNYNSLLSVDVELCYMLKNTALTEEDYDLLIKNELTKIYNEIKDKTIIKDGLFSNKNEDVNSRNIWFKFYLNDCELSSFSLDYNKNTKWNDSYNYLMNKSLVQK